MTKRFPLPMKPDLSARAAFFEAIRQTWRPCPLAALMETAPIFAPWFESRPHVVESLIGVAAAPKWKAFVEDSGEIAAAAREALLHWESSYPFPQEVDWIRDAATLTLWAIHTGRSAGKTFTVSLVPSHRFKPSGVEHLPHDGLRALAWRPSQEDAEAFRSRALRVMKAELSEYMETVRAEVGERNQWTMRDAEIYARRLSGETLEKIADDLVSRHQLEDSGRGEAPNAAMKASAAFARRAGLPLAPGNPRTVGTFVGTRDEKLRKTAL